MKKKKLKKKLLQALEEKLSGKILKKFGKQIKKMERSELLVLLGVDGATICLEEDDAEAKAVPPQPDLPSSPLEEDEEESIAEEEMPPLTEVATVPKPLNIVFVVDCSNSMRQDSRCKNLIKELPSVGETLLQEGESKVALVSFSDEATLLSPLTGDIESLSTAAKSLKPSGWTNAAAGLTVALTQLRQAQGRGLLILLVDGMPLTKEVAAEQIQQQTLALARAAQQEGYTVICVAASSAQGEYYRQLASAGYYRETQNFQDLASILAKLGVDTKEE